MKRLFSVVILIFLMNLFAGCIRVKDYEQVTVNKTEEPKQEEILNTNKMDNKIESQSRMIDYRLNVPVRTQENNYYCGPACLEMVLNYHEIFMSQSQLANELKTSDVTGTEYLDVARVMNKYLFGKEDENPQGAGYHVQFIRQGDSSQSVYKEFEQRVIQDISTNDPIFVAINLNEIYPTLPKANHLVVCTGYSVFEGSHEIEYFYILDPYYVVQNEYGSSLQRISKDVLFKAIYSNDEPAYIW